MKLKEMVEEAVQSGIAPIVFDYQKVELFQEGKHAVRTFMVLNSLDLGTLTYKEYRYVARRTRQGNHMVRRHIDKLIRIIPMLLEEDDKIECFTIPVYARLLKDGELAAMLFDALTLYPEVPPEKVCIELSADILYEDVAEARERIRELRELGVRIAICEVGDEFCPVFRLAELPFDYAFVDDYATSSLDREDCERIAGSLVKYLHYLDVKVIAPGLENDDQVAGAKNVGFDGYTMWQPLPFDTLLPREEIIELTDEESEALAETLPDDIPAAFAKAEQNERMEAEAEE